MTSKIRITTLATAEEARAALLFTHIKTNERNRLIQQMLGTVDYEPRLGGSGQALRCKHSGCENRALGAARKQLCPTHYASFLERSNRAQSRPVCSGDGCNVHTQLTVAGQPMCASCSYAHLTSISKANSDAAHENAKRIELDNAETVHELREWIKEYLI